jgi:hypothetical protein
MTLAEEIMTIEDKHELFDACDRLSIEEVSDKGVVYFKFRDDSFICLKAETFTKG